MVVELISQVVRTINAAGVTILPVEQNARAALELATRIYVMESGVNSMSGETKSLLGNAQIKATYLGETA